MLIEIIIIANVINIEPTIIRIISMLLLLTLLTNLTITSRKIFDKGGIRSKFRNNIFKPFYKYNL